MISRIFFAAVVVVVVIAASASASAQGPPLAMRQDLTVTDAKCQSALDSAAPIYSDLPTPPPSLLTMSLPSDPCEATPAFSGNSVAASDFSSYTSEVMAWYTSHSAALASALAPCPSLASYVTQGVRICTTTTATGSTATDSSSSSLPTSGAVESATSTSRNVAPRETGFLGVAAVAAAGFMGVAVVVL
ncbi:hypothetical protein AAE478_001518 [Parahypoxylon ruwenzoriense]